MNKVVIFGVGSLAHLAYLTFMDEQFFEISAFTVHHEYIDEKQLFGLDVRPYEKIEQTHPPDEYSMFVAIGYKNGNKLREKIFNECIGKGYKLVNCISSKFNMINYIKIGINSLIMPNAIIQPFAEIGNDVVIWGGSYIGYKTHIGDHSYIAPEAAIAGEVEVGSHCFIGINATIKNGLKIAPNCVIGAGAVILKDTEQGMIYPGLHAKVLPIPISELKDFN